MMKCRFVRYLLIVVATILVAGCAIDSKVVRLKYAVINDDINTVKSLLAEHGDMNVNAKDENGNTALMHAASSGEIKIDYKALARRRG